MLSYEERIKRIKTPSDVREQIKEAKLCEQQLRQQLRKADTLDERLGINRSVIAATEVTNRLTRNMFRLEDEVSKETEEMA